MYQAIFFAPNGEHVREGNFETIEEAENYIENIGSRWIFYPLGFVCTKKYVCTEKRKLGIQTIRKWLVNNFDDGIGEIDLQYFWDTVYYS